MLSPLNNFEGILMMGCKLHLQADKTIHSSTLQVLLDVHLSRILIMSQHICSTSSFGRKSHAVYMLACRAEKKEESVLSPFSYSFYSCFSFFIISARRLCFRRIYYLRQEVMFSSDLFFIYLFVSKIAQKLTSGFG